MLRMFSFNTFNKALALLENRHRVKLFYLFLFIFISMVFEIFTLGMLLPILNILVNSDLSNIKYIPSYLFNYDQNTLILIFLASFITVYFIKIIIITLISWFQINFYQDITVYLTNKLFKKYLSQSYTFHLNRNSSELIRNIKDNIAEFSSFGIFSITVLITEMSLVLGMYIFLLFYEFSGTLIISLIIFLIFFVFHKYFSPQSLKLGSKSLIHDKLFLQHLYQGMQSIKEIIILGRQDTFVNNFNYHVESKASINKKVGFIEILPRIWIEFVLILLMSFLISYLFFFNSGSFINFIPTIGIYAAVSIRFIPSFAKILTSIQRLKYGIPKIDNLYSELSLDTIKPKSDVLNKKNIFDKNIKIKNVSFKYEENKEYILDNIDLEIKINSKIGIIGESGAGKTTFVDILLGLLQPTKGNIFIDNIDLNNVIKNWQNNIGYVPQNIILIDDSLKRNIAFGLEDNEIDDDKINHALNKAELNNFVRKLPQGLFTMVGEFGSKLSGGQLQRIGIARALYHNPKVLFLDEATSALDKNTEKNIIKTVMSLTNKTIFVISHKYSSIKDCDKVIEIKNKNIIEIDKSLIS